MNISNESTVRPLNPSPITSGVRSTRNFVELLRPLLQFFCEFRVFSFIGVAVLIFIKALRPKNGKNL